MVGNLCRNAGERGFLRQNMVKITSSEGTGLVNGEFGGFINEV